MAYKIIPDLCNACGACESECPNRAISHIGKDYTIDATKCQQCEGVYDSPNVRPAVQHRRLRAGLKSPTR